MSAPKGQPSLRLHVEMIAHDLNNHIGVVLGFAEVLLLNRELDDAVRSQVEEIRTAARRSKELVRIGRAHV